MLEASIEVLSRDSVFCAFNLNVTDSYVGHEGTDVDDDVVESCQLGAIQIRTVPTPSLN